MGGPKQRLWKIFCTLVQSSTLQHHRQQEKCSCFLPIWICRIQWLCSLFPISTAIPFLGKFGPKNKNYQFILKFGTWTNSNMQNSMVMFNFSPFYWNYPFWANLVQLIKFVHLSWNLVLRLIRIRSIRMNNSMVHLICFMLEIPFLSKLGPKNENCQFMLKYGT